jgi:mannose-1-phosphate guanylyltransferase
LKAFLLAAGLGTRLRPITDAIPKCLVSVCGKPLLSWWIDLFEQHGISEVLINMHYLSDQVAHFIKNKKTSVKLSLFHEETLLGSGGTLRANKNFVKNDDYFLIAYADNLTNYNLTALKDFHINHNDYFTMSLFTTDTPESKGIVELDKNNKVISFEEKPSHPKSNLANAGIYVASPAVLDVIPNKKLTDIGFDLLPKLVGHMYGWETNDYLIDIGTSEHLERANNEWAIINKGVNIVI